jgi:hypothetical protein
MGLFTVWKLEELERYRYQVGEWGILETLFVGVAVETMQVRIHSSRDHAG